LTTKPIAEEDAAEIRSRYPLMFLQMNEPQARFIRVKNASGRTPRRRILECGNKVGKTHIGIAEDIAHMMGFRPWLKADDPDYRIDIKVPNVGLVAGETVMHSISEKIVPTFRELIPDYCKPVFKAGPTGVPIKVTLPIDVMGKKCGSECFFRSYDQRADTFEGIDMAWFHADEPPPEDVLQAIERGKVVTNAPSWYTMTPLKQAYFYSKFSSRAGIRV
jgi:phage terminase large subunit-like protein